MKIKLLLTALLLGTANVAMAESANDVSLDLVSNGFIIMSTVLVILMSLPGIGLFYGGMVRTKNMCSVLVQTLTAFALMYLLWAMYGYSLASSNDSGSFLSLFFGDFSNSFLVNITPSTVDTSHSNLSELVYFAFQGAFAAITACLIIGSFAERIKYLGLIVVLVIWFTFAYVPSWHMVWGGGWLDSAFGVLDFAGGTVVHINASICALVGAYYVGNRIGYGREAMKPHSLTMTMIGTGLLWVGWFGFNAGSELTPDGTSALAFVNTILAPAASVVSWLLCEWVVKGKPSLLGACSGAIAGLVVITPACGFVGVNGAIIMGLVGGAACLWGVHGLKRALRVDDTLDVFGVHGLGGIIGAIMTGIFCSPDLGGTGFGGDNTTIWSQTLGQLISVVVTIVWTGAVAWFGFFVAHKLTGIRVSRDEERQGLDLASHGERAYNY
ncbi:MAG: ammonium transporter [Succinivibrionaceae bacterium]|jgi:Amt family ammonium transporter|nr:ammonium transporter [Succinivibrionaceae bacterium]